MCTVTYLPKGNGSFILTSNRDESGSRPTIPPKKYDHLNHKILFPKDEVAGGTWIAVADNGRFGCVLNGAFERHQWDPPYRKSRGVIMLEMLIAKDQKQFAETTDFEGVEPFTFLFGCDDSILEVRWDGERIFMKSIDPLVPHIWSSAQLYPKEVRAKRAHWFEDWLKKHDNYSVEEILNFHQYGGEGDTENDLVMNRYGLVQTVSITCLVKEADHYDMIYQDLTKVILSSKSTLAI